MASFYPASVGDFLVDLIIPRFTWRRESLPAVETFCPSPHFFSSTSRLRDTEWYFLGQLFWRLQRQLVHALIWWLWFNRTNTEETPTRANFWNASELPVSFVSVWWTVCQVVVETFKTDSSVWVCVFWYKSSQRATLMECRVTLPTSTSVLRLSDKSWFVLSVYLSRQKETEPQYNEGQILQTSLR